MSADILRILVVVLGIIVVAIVLIQQPKEGGISAFTGGGGGSGASGTVFGAKGSGSFFFRLTAGAALVFAALVITLVKVTNSDIGGSVISTPTQQKQAETTPNKAAEADVLPGANQIPNNQSHSSDGEVPGAVDTKPDQPQPTE